MRIEIATSLDSTTTEKGDLLESLAAEFLQTQGFKVTSKVRLTAGEFDLLCDHEVSGKRIYVECKAHRDLLSATHLTTILGKVEFNDYAEGWLVSTGPLGKDAKGFTSAWEDKDQEKRAKLSIYYPSRVIDALSAANLICRPPAVKAKDLPGATKDNGDWTLLITPWGWYWACPTLDSGVPVGAIAFDARTAEFVSDEPLLARIQESDSSLRQLQFFPITPDSTTRPTSDSPAVVEVECGEKWTDYRPSRPEHFVGRARLLRDILRFLTDVKKERTESRVFAVKGDSGIGKSSLIAKLRDVASISKKPNNLFLHAVDVRAASDSSYIHAALLSALRAAAAQGFSTGKSSELTITDYADPLQSRSIADFLRECERKHELIILVFDQFEELYSKPELFSVFSEAKKLMFSSLAASTSFVLGFAWKTDSTVPQDHPAYHLWHELADHRYEVLLRPFSHADAQNSVRLFEGELGEKIRPEIHRCLIENSQGYPWLLKKLCIHLYEQVAAGGSQTSLADRSLDIAELFDRDLSNLTPAETACLKVVAEHAPMDWYDVLETTQPAVVQALQQRRLLIRRGDKLNLYWDIFRDYVLTGNIPLIPFTYMPQAPSLGALLRLAVRLDPGVPRTIEELANEAEVSANTARNIVHDLEQFGVACSEGPGVSLDPHMAELTSRAVLTRIRTVLRRHALTVELRENNHVAPADQSDVIQYLKKLNPAAQHHSRTWKTYANRMTHWLQTLGFLVDEVDGVVFQDQGDIAEGAYRFGGERKRIVFIGDAPPWRAAEALKRIVRSGPQSSTRMRASGFRNACAILYRFGLVEITPAHEYRVVESTLAKKEPLERILDEATKEDSVRISTAFLREFPRATTQELGQEIAKRFERKWTSSTCLRIGNGLRQWSIWLFACETAGRAVLPAVHRGTDMMPATGPSLFDEEWSCT